MSLEEIPSEVLGIWNVKEPLGKAFPLWVVVRAHYTPLGDKGNKGDKVCRQARSSCPQGVVGGHAASADATRSGWHGHRAGSAVGADRARRACPERAPSDRPVRALAGTSGHREALADAGEKRPMT